MVLTWQKTKNCLTANERNYQLICQRAWVEIDENALVHNVREIRRLLSPQTQLMAVVKADAYGHGAIGVAKTVLSAGASWLAIATLAEGIELRQAGITAPILILGAINTQEEIRFVSHWQLQPTLCNAQQAMVFAETLASQEQILPVHLKLDTGMSRLGTSWHDALAFVKFVKQLPNLQIASIYSHLATADDPNPTIMRLQHRRFQEAIASIVSQNIPLPLLHLANSAATISDRSLHYDLVRVGLALYGLYSAPHLKSKLDLKPVLEVKARVTQVKTIPAGTGVSYGYKFIAQEDLAIAVVGIGYADGVPRNLSGRLKVLIRGQLVPQIGAITMDQMMLDVSSIPDLQPGEIVTLIGKNGHQQISVDDWASKLETISWEILCGFKHRLPRVILNLGLSDDRFSS